MRSVTRLVSAVVLALATLVMLPGPALAAGTVTVSVAGTGSVTGVGINCTQTGGPDCSEFYDDTRVCEFDPEIGQPVCTREPQTVQFEAGPGSNGFAFSAWSGCDFSSGRTCEATVAGSRTISATFSDVQAPSVSITSAGGVRSGVVRLAATASDNAGVQRVEFRVRGAVVGTDFSAPYELFFDTRSVSDGVAAIQARAFDTAGLATTAGGSMTIDNTAPSLTVTGGPDGQTFGPGSTQTWTFTASDATLSSVQCSVVPDGQPASYGACSGGSASHSVTNQPDGVRRFSVRALDGAGQSTVVERTFTINGPGPTGPEVTITGGPASGATVSSSSVTWTFSLSGAGSTAECRVYPSGTPPPAFGACTGSGTHTASGLAEGTHVFDVRGRDASGTPGPSASRTVTVDTAPEPPPPGAPPVVTITGGPDDGATVESGSITWFFAADQPGAAVECRLYPAGTTPPPFGACSSAGSFSAAGLVDASYRFEVRGRDGEVLGPVAGRTVTVRSSVEPPPDTMAPDTVLDRKPEKRLVASSRYVRVRFDFHATENDARFECKVDFKAWSACTSPTRFKVARGIHVVRVRAIDAAGNADASSVKHRFRVVRG